MLRALKNIIGGSLILVIGLIFFVALYTLILHFATTFLFSFDFAVMVTLPVFLAFTLPLEFTVAIFLLEDDQVTLFEAFAGLVVFTFRVTVCPTERFFFV